MSGGALVVELVPRARISLTTVPAMLGAIRFAATLHKSNPVLVPVTAAAVTARKKCSLLRADVQRMATPLRCALWQ